MRKALLASLFTFSATLATGAAAQSLPAADPTGAVCPDTMTAFSSLQGVVLGCDCTAPIKSGSIWGSGPYTDDSKLCSAAVHAGVITDKGGVIWVTPSAGQGSFTGSQANGVTTSDYGSFPSSFTFVAAPAGGGEKSGKTMCPANMTGQSAPLSCSCDASLMASGTVWGTDAYTADSSICRAALHAGKIDASGGDVTAVPISGLDAYTGSSRNGVSSENYGAWGESYIFQ